jgi:hypothetical protein
MLSLPMLLPLLLLLLRQPLHPLRLLLQQKPLRSNS